MLIRNEKIEDYKQVEELTREAFWNVNVPGCAEHYLAHTLRKHEDFIPKLDFILEQDGKIIANIMYAKTLLIDENGGEKTILTFGPLSVLPKYQRKGYGKMLLEHSFEKAIGLGYDAIVIFGNPENYISRGFKNCIQFNVSLGEDIFPTAMLVKELCDGALEGKNWVYKESAAYEIDEKAAEEFDKKFEPLEKCFKPSQELFYIYSHSTVRK